MQEFEQLRENILLNDKVVFTLAQLEKYVIESGALDTGLIEDVVMCEEPFDKRYSTKEVNVLTPVSEYLDDETNFQNACNELYNKLFK